MLAVVLVQGSGTMCNESVIGSAVPRDGGKLLVMSNGAYGVRLGKIATTCGIETVVHETLEDTTPPLKAVTTLLDEAAAAGSPFTTMAIVHHETTSGILNPVQEISLAAKDRGCTTILDAMSSFGGIPIDLEACGIDFLVTIAPNISLGANCGYSGTTASNFGKSAFSANTGLVGTEDVKTGSFENLTLGIGLKIEF